MTEKNNHTVNGLPKEWELKSFEDLLDYIQPTPYIVESVEYSDTYKTPVLTAGKTFILGNTNEKKGIFNSLPVIIFDDFTTANKFVNFPFKVKSSAMKILKPKNESINLKFVFYYMQTVRISFDTHKRYWISVFSKLQIPLPPPLIRQAIVSKIEELFSELDKGIEQLKMAQQQLKVYRQAVLKWAFEGRLTNENVKDGELPEGWKRIQLKEISESIQYGYTESSSKEPIGPKFLRITDIQENKVVWNEVPYCKIDNENKKKYLLKEGDLVFARTGATVGKSFLIKGEIPEAIFASYLIRVRVNKEINEKFLSYFFYSPEYWSQITEGQVGIGQPNVNGTKLGQLQFVVAPMKEQNLIVQEIETRLSVADKLEETITDSLQQAEALRQSILKKAFEGQLVSTP